jgi:hypothetical protein
MFVRAAILTLLLVSGRQNWVSVSEEGSRSDPPRYTAGLEATLEIDGIQRLDEHAFKIAEPCAREFLARLAADTSVHTCFVPSLRDGRALGAKLFCIRPGGVFNRLGFRNGDVLTSLAGFALDSSGAGLSAYEKVQQLIPVIDATIIRNGTPMELRVFIEPAQSLCAAFDPTPSFVACW